MTSFLESSLLLVPALLTATSLTGQNLVQNPGFEAATLSPWTHNGTSTHTVKVESYDVTGRGKSNAIACTPDTTHFELRQAGFMVQVGRRYSFSMDLASFWPNPNNYEQQADAGQFSVYVGTQRVAFLALGTVHRDNPLLRRRLSVTFTPLTTGTLDLRIQIHRSWPGKYNVTPRCYVDNVEFRDLLVQSSAYGASCQPALSATSTAKREAEFLLSNADPNGVGLLWLGTATLNVKFPGTSCYLLTEPLALFPQLVDSQGKSVWRMPVPAGAFFFNAQAASMRINTLSLVTSNGLKVVTSG